MTSQDNIGLIRRLLDQRAEFIIVGGVAAYMHGSSYPTDDVDIVAPFSPDNISRILEALAPLHPRHAITPGRRPITESADEIAGWKNLYVVTDAGRLDILGELPPFANYDEVAARARKSTIGGLKCKVISIDDLITLKSHLGREKDRLVERELRAIRERNQRSDSEPDG
ncbi:MAG: nucleotidyltransferase [Planctomycetota bacterium]|nr:nucleotidyltransferase [Planctomycetota bacterium]